jgi:hypothetical protein
VVPQVPRSTVISGTRDNASIQDFFARELSEVYLLLDNVTATSHTTLISPSKPSDDRQPPPGEWIEEICEIRFPPEESKADQARQAAKLLRARDYLNSLVAPANGSTIAFTYLVAGDSAGDGSSPDSIWPPFGRLLGSGSSSKRKSSAFALNAPSRYSLAKAAFPGLVAPARRFRISVWFIVTGFLIWLLITSAVSWNLAMGRGALQRLEAATVELNTVRKDIAGAQVETVT